jgi:hypothetical protein
VSALVSCPLCGARFPAAAACPPGCLLARGCRTVCCPNCHYRFVASSSVVRWLGRLVGRRIP